MQIGPLVSRNLVSVGPDHTLLDAAKRMVERNVGAAIVLSDDGAPGIITERDLLRAIASGAAAQDMTVSEYASANAVTASESWDVKAALECMFEGGFRHLIVLDDAGRVAGMLSIRDLVNALLDQS